MSDRNFQIYHTRRERNMCADYLAIRYSSDLMIILELLVELGLQLTADVIGVASM